jgi:hypothetical protein
MSEFREPWGISRKKTLTIEDASGGDLFLSVSQIEAMYPAETHLFRHGEERCQTEALLHRIVACVNFCRNLETAWMEGRVTENHYKKPIRRGEGGLMFWRKSE